MLNKIQDIDQDEGGVCYIVPHTQKDKMFFTGGGIARYIWESHIPSIYLKE